MKILCISVFLLGLVARPAMAQVPISYCKDILEQGNPPGGTCDIIGGACNADEDCAGGALKCINPPLKTWDETWQMQVGETIDMDIWINDVPENLLTSGCSITYDPSLISITNVFPYDTSTGGPWDAGGTVSLESEPGQWVLGLVNYSCVQPDSDGDIILAKVTFRREGGGDTTITITTIPDFDTVVGCTGSNYDGQISPNTVTIVQPFVDADNDGIQNYEDNCPLVPNGPLLGTCLYGTVGVTCTSSHDCDPNGFCSMNQEDRDRDTIGDVCDDITMCKGNFDFDSDVDGTDAALFKEHFGRSAFNDPCPSDGPAPVAKTWQTVPYANGDDGYHQRGVAYPSPRFTDNGDGAVKDNLTGLIWLKDAGCFNTKPWFNALLICNSLANGTCGLTDGSTPGDWRLPNYKELLSLVDVETGAPVLPNGHPFSNVQSFNYWTSSTYFNAISSAWFVDMNDGRLDFENKTNFGRVWPVRGGH